MIALSYYHCNASHGLKDPINTQALLNYFQIACIHVSVNMLFESLRYNAVVSSISSDHIITVYSVNAYDLILHVYYTAVSRCIQQCVHAYLLLYGAIGSTNHSGHFHPLSFPLVTPISTSPVLASPCCSGFRGACMHAAYHTVCTVQVSVTVSLCAFTYHALDSVRIGITVSLCMHAMLEITELFTEYQLFAAAKNCHYTAASRIT
jgi:hypothetical protein